jgi:hypothetical protein
MRRAAVYASTEPSSSASPLTATTTSGTFTVSGSVSIRRGVSLVLIQRELEASEGPIWMSDM